MHRIIIAIIALICVFSAANPAQARHFRHSIHAHIAVSDFSASRKARSHQRRSFRRYAHYRHGGYRVRLAHAVPAAVPQATWTMTGAGGLHGLQRRPAQEAPVKKTTHPDRLSGAITATIREITGQRPQHWAGFALLEVAAAHVVAYRPRREFPGRYPGF